MAGNKTDIHLRMLCSQDESELVRTAFKGQFEECDLSPVNDDRMSDIRLSAWTNAVFADFHPPPPYSHLLTRPDELKRSPYAGIFSALASLPKDALGFYQVVFMPVSPEHNWHRNVEALMDLEFNIKLIGGVASSYRHTQQAPSGDLRMMSSDVETKSHDDKPFFGTALRLGILNGGETAQRRLHALALPIGLIRHGGRPLSTVTEATYQKQLSPDNIRDMFMEGRVYRHGFLLNSCELSSLVHIPPFEISEPYHLQVSALETLPPSESLREGTRLGTCIYMGREIPVCIPYCMETKSKHIIGRPGVGKSSALEHEILQKVSRKHSVAIVDPHGLLVQRLLYLLPEECIDRVIYFNPGDPKFVPIWNPLGCRSAFGPSRIANDLVGAFKSFVSGWGHRLEHLLTQAAIGALHLPEASLLDISNLLRKKCDAGSRLRSQVAQAMDDELAQQFWRHDFDSYSDSDLAPAQHKLSKLLSSGTVSLMLKQTESFFDLRDIMETGKILLLDLSSLAGEVRKIMGCLTLSLLHLTALERGNSITEERLPCHLFCDEAHMFMTDALEDLIIEMRKYDVSLTLAHQFMSQFDSRKSGALSSTGSTIIFNVGAKDAQRLRNDLRGKVSVDDIISLEMGQAIARIGTEIVRFRTQRPLEIPDRNFRDIIIAESRRRYCKPVDEVRQSLNRRDRFWVPADEKMSVLPKYDEKDFRYDTF